MAVAIIINPISGGASPAAARERAQFAHDRRRCPRRTGGRVRDRTPGPRARSRQRRRETGRRSRDGVGRGRHDQRGGVRAGVRPTCRSRSFRRIRQRPGARARRESCGPTGRLPMRSPLSRGRMDVGELDGHLFFNIAGIGLDAYVAWQFSAASPPRAGRLRGDHGADVGHLRPEAVPNHARGGDGRRAGGARDDCELGAVRKRRPHCARREGGRRITGPGRAGRAVPDRDALSPAAVVQRDRAPHPGLHGPADSTKSPSNPTSRCSSTSTASRSREART